MDTPGRGNWLKLHMLLSWARAALQDLFLTSWKIKTGKEWDKSCSEIVLGHKIKNVTKELQKTIEQGNVADWDITTLDKLLCAEGLFDTSSEQKELIGRIVEVRNQINHLPQSVLTQQQFDESWKILREALTDLGISENDCEQLRQESHISGVEVTQEAIVDDRNTTTATKLKDEGNAEFKKGHYSRAIELYTTGIGLPGIPNESRAILFSNRCMCYLKKYKTAQDENDLSNGKADAKEIVTLRPNWWKGYCRLGQVYMELLNYDKAIHCLNNALAKDPQNKEAANLLSTARYRQGEYERTVNLNQHTLHGLSIADIVSATNRSSGFRISSEHIRELEDSYSKSVHPEMQNRGLCRQGDKYRCGLDGYVRDCQLAVKYYKMAADRRSAEGMFKLGLMFYYGEGTEQDFAEGIKWFKKAARQPPDLVSDVQKNARNLGVAEAQNALGYCYFKGIGVTKDITASVQWYQKGSDNGSANAALKLGNLYEYGIIDRKTDLIKAEQYYRLSVNRSLQPDCGGMLCLTHLYYEKGDLERALSWCDRAVANGNWLPEWHKLKTKIKKDFDLFQQSGVIPWELESHRRSDGLTINQRKERYYAATNKDHHECYESLKLFKSKLERPLPGAAVTTQTRFDHLELLRCAEHSAYGRSLLTAKEHIFHALEIMESELTHGTPSLSRYQEFVKEFSAGAQINTLVIEMPQSFYHEAVAVLNLLLPKKVTFDEDVRICCAALRGLQNPKDGVPFLDECVRLYPQNVFFLKIRADLNAFLSRFEDGVRDMRLALKLAPDDVDILFGQAGMMRLADTFKPNDAIETYKQFVKFAPNDHRHVPEAFYQIAVLTLDKLRICKNLGPVKANEYLVEAKEYYEKGVVAEERQLSFFLPYQSNAKAIVEYMFPLRVKEWNSCLPLLTPNPNSTTETEKIERMRQTLTDPYRILHIKHLRKYAAAAHKHFNNAPPGYILFPVDVHAEPYNPQQFPASLEHLKAISLWDMDPTKEFIYEGHVLAVTVISDVVLTGTSVHVIIEDKDGCVEQCFIKNSPYNDDLVGARRNFGPGCKMSIINPFKRICVSREPAIRVDDPGTIVFDGFVPNMCCYCCRPNANLQCVTCKVARYCNKTCQISDWKTMKHKLICETLSGQFLKSESVITMKEYPKTT